MRGGYRNRNGRRGNDPRGANQQRQAAASRDGTPNAQQNRRGGKAGSNIIKSSDGTQNGPAVQTQLSPPDEHIPIAGFNSDAVDAMLKQGFEAKAPLYKPEVKPQPTKPDNPWGAKRESSAACLSILSWNIIGD